MKNIFKTIIAWVLKFESKRVLAKYKPKIVAVTGSVGKTSTKDAIYAVMAPICHVRKSAKSFNSEIGIPLTILGCDNAWSNPVKWLANFLKGLKLIVFKAEYPDWLVLEIGADRPGEIKSIMEWLRPDVSVVTWVGTVPVHVEFYDSPQDVVREKSHLVSGVKKDGVVILNADDPSVLEMKNLTTSRVFTFGIKNKADVVAVFPQIIYEEGMPKGYSFKADVGGNSLPVSVLGALGTQHIYPYLAAFTVASSENFNLLEAADALSKHITAPGRMKLLTGIHNSTIIDDTYNASPVAVEEGLNVLQHLAIPGRKIAILGDMLELGRYSSAEHKKIGAAAAASCDLLFAVGIRAKDYLNAAAERKMRKNKMKHFDDSVTAGKYAAEILKPGDVVFVKGSQGIRMEKTVELILAQPERKSEVLVRQEDEWRVR